MSRPKPVAASKPSATVKPAAVRAPSKKNATATKKVAAVAPFASTTTSTTPPKAALAPTAPAETLSNKLVLANSRDKHKVSDAIVDALTSAVAEVQTLTGVDIGTGFGDTVRALGSGTKKVGADNFSWHKSGRAVDLNQGLEWVIAKDSAGTSMYFRIYLEANDEGAKSIYAKTIGEDEKSNLHYNALGKQVTKKTLVDVTSILESYGFERIPAHSGWETSYNKREWWHYVKDDGLTWYQALNQIYTNDEIVTEMKKLVDDRHSDGGRLSREGFPPDTLKAIWDNRQVSRGKLHLSFSVGSDKDCANIPDDVAAVRSALTGLGIADDLSIAKMILDYEKSKDVASPSGTIVVGGATHRDIGAEMN
jgi:hypothetical protein